MSKFCSNCGTQLDDNARFCNNCGTQIDVPTAETTIDPQIAYQTPQKPTPQKPNKKKILITVIAVIVAIGAIIGILFATGIIGKKNDPNKAENTPESIVKVFLQHVSKNDAEKAIDCAPSFIWGNDETRKPYYLSGIQSFIDSYPNLSFQILSTEDLPNTDKQTLIASLQWMQFTAGGFVATDVTEYKVVEVKLTYTENNETHTENIRFTVIKYKDEWKIYNFE